VRPTPSRTRARRVIGEGRISAQLAIFAACATSVSCVTMQCWRGFWHIRRRRPAAQLTVAQSPWLSRCMLQRHTRPKSTLQPAALRADAAASLLVLVLITSPTSAGRTGV